MTQSSDKQPKNKPPVIKTRQPQKRTGGFFDNLRQPHPIEEILGLQQDTNDTPAVTPVAAPVVSPAETPVATPVITTVETAVSTPVGPVSQIGNEFPLESERPRTEFTVADTAVSSPVATPAATPVTSQTQQSSHLAPVATPVFTPVAETAALQQNRQFVSLDSTHTGSEQRVYSVMYRETIAKKIAERHFGTAELMRATGIRSDKTVRLAIDGLLQKKSIGIVRYDVGNRLGPRYRIFGPKEIFEMRARCGIEIDPQSKKILPPVDTTAATPVFTPVDTVPLSTVNTGVTGPVVTGRGNYPSTPVESTGPYKYHELSNADSDVESSSASIRDDIERVKVLFDQLANGGKWRDDRDNATFEQIASIPLWHIIMGLCYSVARSPEHKMSSLAYAVPQIQEHYKQMQFFPDSDMLEIAYRTLRRTLLCISTGNWTIPDWETGK